MSRNLTVQLVIALLLVAVLGAVTINIVQFNSIESTVIEVRQKTEHNATLINQLKEKVDSGVTVNGGTMMNNGGNQAAAVEKVAGNILEVDPTPLRAASAESGGELRLASGSDFKGFNRIIENSTDVQDLYRLFVGNSLARRHYNDPDKWHGELATSIVPNGDFTVYTVKLRKGVKWHKPAVDFANPRYKWLDKDHHVTADDFVFGLEMLLDEKVAGAASSRSYFEDFDRIEVVNDHEFKLHWKKKVYKSKAVVLEGVRPVPRWLYGYNEDGELYDKAIVADKFNSHWYNDRAIGTGPYRFVESKPGEFLKLTRNEEYFGGKTALKKITYLIIKDPNLRLLKFKKGELDVMSLTPTQYRKEILEDENSPFNKGKFQKHKLPRLAYRYLGWNAKNPLFADKRARRAMTHAFNREKMVSEVFSDLGRVTTSNFYIDSPWNDKSIKPLKFDLDKSKALLAEAGWKDSDGDGVLDKKVNGEKKDFEFRLLIYNSSPEFKSMGDIFKEDLIKIGVRLKVTPVDWPTMQKKMEDKEFEAFTGGWGLDWDADPNQLWHSTQADKPKGSNFVSFKNAEADKIIEDSSVAFDHATRVKLFNRFHQIVHEEQPYSFFMAPDSVMVYQNNVENMTFQKPRPQVLYQLLWKQQEK